MKEKIIQFGEGGFLRGFVDWMLQQVNEKTDFNGKVVVVQPIAQGMCDALTAQNCTYTHVCRGVEGVDTRVIDVISRCVKPYDDFDAYLALAENADFRFIVSNTTEAGICYSEADRITDRPAKTFPGKLTQLLKRRFDLGLPGFVFLPCELNDRNGDLLKGCLMQYADLWELGEDYKAWLEQNNIFCCTLVDRINTGFPKGEDLGIDDPLLNASEYFHLWVIEGYSDLCKELPLDKCGLNVIVTDELERYRTRKVRILNGAHTSMVAYSMLSGLETVKDSMEDETMSAFLRRCVFEEIIPTLDLPKDELEDYANNVLKRFANPYIKHYWSSIALNSVSKFKVRVLPSILTYRERFGTYPKNLMFAFKKLLDFYKTDMTNDDPEVTAFMKKASLSEILANTALWGQDLSCMESMRIDPRDNVRVCVQTGAKYAHCAIKKGEAVIKYGQPIGYALCDIARGELVHTHNLKTGLSGKLEYRYTPAVTQQPVLPTDRTFMGYVRENGEVGIRNDIWIVNTVGCINKVAEALAKKTGAKCFPHPYGCSQLGDDQLITQKILKGLIEHPNAGGVLVLGLGCENNNIGVFQEILGSWDDKRVKFLNMQDVEDELEAGTALIRELKANAAKAKRTPVAVSKLCIGLKCGGSDGLSGITANPLVGRFCDAFTSMGAGCVLTEVPEMFGAEHLLMNRCQSEEVFEKTVALINNFKDYFTRHHQVIYENPSPGNKAGGITTLEEKSLGCIQKGGSAPVVDVLDYGDRVQKPGLSLLNGPGNDMVAVTNLTAAGAHMILFTTGRGTPLGGPVPTVKISTNKALAEKKKNWIDFDASPVLDGQPLTQELIDYVLRVANGEQTKNEINGCEEIAIFKDGVTL